MGNEAECSPWTYADVISHTTGIDCFIDGHSHDIDQVVLSRTAQSLLNLTILEATRLKHAETDACYFLAADRATGRILYADPDLDMDAARELVADTIYELARH